MKKKKNTQKEIEKYKNKKCISFRNEKSKQKK